MKKLIAPSILSANFAKLSDEIQKVTAAGADWLHVDVMDGHFVNNLTIGPVVISSLKPYSKIPLDVHLMIEKPERYIKDFIKAGADFLTIHVESTDQVEKCLKEIKSNNIKAGITLRPGTSIDQIKKYLSFVDLVLVMTVEPGFGGQSFMQDQVNKIDELYNLKTQNGFKYLIEVDGGINDKTIQFAKMADVFVAGNFVFKSEDYAGAIQKLRNGVL
jgi:ribulose-phosphate 3-epimerase